MSTVTTADLRSYFRTRPDKMSALSEAAQKTVREGARGKVHAEAVKAFNTKRAKNRRYVVGATKSANTVRAEQREALKAAGLAGGRGPLSKAAKAHLKSLSKA